MATRYFNIKLLQLKFLCYNLAMDMSLKGSAKLDCGRIYNIDCVKGMREFSLLKSGVDLIVADPPYIISRGSNFHTMKDRKNARTGTDFGKWDQEFENAPWIKAAFDTLKKGGSLIAFNDFKKVSEIISIAIEMGFEYKDVLVWEKSNPMPRNRDRRYVPSLEMMVWFVKPGAKWTFNRLVETYQSPVLKFASESGGGFKRIHPTQKPVKLMEALINVHSNKNDVILDPFMGSGATAIASINTGRDFIGFELDPHYCELANDRIQKHRSNM
ncbi:MAG: site-specific DNA-methyltransferase [Candidatus Woesebacteria bacterium]|jgi:DNA modification methylase